MKPTKLFCISSAIAFQFGLSNCSENFLNQKPDLSQASPSTLLDCRAMLDDYSRMNASYSDHGEAAGDNYYFTDANYGNLRDVNNSAEGKDNYIWNPLGEHVGEWGRGYQVIYSANLILGVVNNSSPSDPDYNVIKGSALFFRAFAYYNLAQLFCKPFDVNTASSDLGIPLRLTSDFLEKSVRGSVEEVYNQIIADLKESIDFLPIDVFVKSRPSKAAAYAALARTYLAMEDYVNAKIMADACLKLYSTLIDYNSTSVTPTTTTVRAAMTGASFSQFNAEIIFQALTTSGTLTQAAAFIHPDLYNTYEVSDCRKTVYFQSAGGGTFVFRGNYSGFTSAAQFIGLATDEMYLIRAECYAREGNTVLAMADLNTLMAKRMKPPYNSRTATSANDALVQILTERRKELVFRTLRWTDLRRLNKDPQFAITLRRDMNTILYEPLKPNDLRYTFLIPTREVIVITGMDQNPR